MNAAQTPTHGYLSSRSYSTDAGPFSHAGGGTALTTGKLEWSQVDEAHVPPNASNYLRAQAGYLQPGAWVSTSFGERWYALHMTNTGPIYLEFAIVDGNRGLGAPSGIFHPGGIHVVSPAQALVNFGTGLAQYIAAHGCDGSSQMVTLVQGYQGALNTFMADIQIAHKSYVPFTVDGVYSVELQAYLLEFAKAHAITFTPCTGLPHANQQTPPPLPTPPPQKTGGTQPAAPSTGLSTNAKIGIGVGVLAVGAVGLWMYSQSEKHSKKGKR